MELVMVNQYDGMYTLDDIDLDEYEMNNLHRAEAAYEEFLDYEDLGWAFKVEQETEFGLGWGIIRKYDGAWITPPVWDRNLSFRDGMIRLKADACDTTFFVGGYAITLQNRCYGLINEDCKEILPCCYSDLYYEHGQLEAVSKDYTHFRFEIKDIVSKEIDLSQWEDSKCHLSGPHAVKKNGKWGYIDRKGNPLFPFQWEEAYCFWEGMAVVKQNGKYGYIDRSGALVIPCQWDWAYTFTNGIAIVKQNGKYHCLKKEKNPGTADHTPAPWRLWSTPDYEDGFTIVTGEKNYEHNCNYGLIDLEETLVFPCAAAHGDLEDRILPLVCFAEYLQEESCVPKDHDAP